MGDKRLIKSGSRASSSQSRTSIVKSITSSGQERKSLEWVDDLLLEESNKQESKADYTSDTWARIVASELTMADVDEKIQQVEQELFGSKQKTSRDKKSRVKDEEEEVDEYEDEEEDSTEPKSFTFDLGRLDDQVSELIKLLENITFHGGKPMPDATGLKSVYTATRDNMNRLGLQVVLNRVAIAFEYKNLKLPKETGSHSTLVNITSDSKTNIWDKLKGMKMSEILRTLIHRTDGVFGKELGIISGSLLLYPRHAIVMVEGPEISLVDYFNQVFKSSFMQRLVKGKVLFIMPHVLIRYFDEWSELEAVPPEREEEGEIKVEDPKKVKQLLKILGHKCSNFWKYLRKNKLTGLGRTCEGLPEGLLPEEILIEIALNSTVLRPLDEWMLELSILDFKESPIGDSWPEPEPPLPETAFKPDQYIESLGVTVKPTSLPVPSKELDQFLTANNKVREKPERDPPRKDKKTDATKSKESTFLKKPVGKDAVRKVTTAKETTSKGTTKQDANNDKTKSRSNLWKVSKKK